MARKLTVNENQIALSGIVTTNIGQVMSDGKKYFKFWSPIWDIILKNPEIASKPEAKDPKHWVWHAAFEEQVDFSIPAELIEDYQKVEHPNMSDRTIWFSDRLLARIASDVEELEKKKRKGLTSKRKACKL